MTHQSLTVETAPLAAEQVEGKDLGFFERYLTIWVALCIVAGVALGQLVPAVPDTLMRFTYAEVNIPVAILIWFMIYPMMVQIDFASILGVRKQPKGLALTLAVNWLIKPFSMFAIAWLFLLVILRRSSRPTCRARVPGRRHSAGAQAPCTAMVLCGVTSPRATRLHARSGFGERPDHARSPLRLSWRCCWAERHRRAVRALFLSVVLYIVVPLAAAMQRASI